MQLHTPMSVSKAAEVPEPSSVVTAGADLSRELHVNNNYSSLCPSKARKFDDQIWFALEGDESDKDCIMQGKNR